MSISPLNSSFGKVGFGVSGQLSDRQTTSDGGQLVGSPFKRGLQACAGGSTTGAVPHMVKKNIGIIANLFIWKVVIVS